MVCRVLRNYSVILWIFYAISMIYPKTKTEARLSSLIPTHDQQRLPGTENSIRPNPEIMQYPASTSTRREQRERERERRWLWEQKLIFLLIILCLLYGPMGSRKWYKAQKGGLDQGGVCNRIIAKTGWRSDFLIIVNIQSKCGWWWKGHDCAWLLMQKIMVFSQGRLEKVGY